MDYKQNIIFKSDKKELTMNSKEEIHIIEITGIEASSYTINTSNAEQDGTTVTSVKIEPREITIIGDIEKNDNDIANREKLIRFFNPKKEGEMYITRNKIKRKIKYRVSSLDFVTNKMYERIQFTIVLESTEEPYFSDEKNKSNS